MRCGYEGGWAKFLGIGLELLDGYHSPRGAAPTRAASFGGLVEEPRLEAKLWVLLRYCGMAAIRRGARLLQGERCFVV